MMNGTYSKYFSEKKLWEKIKKYSKVAGVKVIYAVLLLFYTLQDKRVDMRTKVGIAAALGYFILPSDAIFDLTPLIGYTDDLGVLMFALSQISINLTPQVKEKAKAKLAEWFGEINAEDLQDIEKNTL
jgi:uncharacterized membrane protein YkvA (DUF1232 family)